MFPQSYLKAKEISKHYTCDYIADTFVFELNNVSIKLLHKGWRYLAEDWYKNGENIWVLRGTKIQVTFKYD